MTPEERKRLLSGKSKPSRSGSTSRSANGRDAQAQGADGKGRNVPQQKQTLGQFAWSWVKTILGAVAIVMVVNGLLIASFVVPTGSMENEVMTGDFVFVNKFIYGGSSPQTIPFLDIPLPFFRLPGLRDPEKGDVIVFIFPGFRNEIKAKNFEYYLKRCVATAGDTLQVIDKKVFVNGKEQPVPPNAVFADPAISKISNETFPPESHFTRDNWGPMRIPKEGDVIPLNDSTCTSYEIFIQREGHKLARQGEVVLIDDKPATSYTVERDYVFGMGDNRDMSLDSRFWGFVPKENVVGTPLIVYWSMPVAENYDADQDGRPDPMNLFKRFSNVRWNRIFNTIE